MFSGGADTDYRRLRQLLASRRDQGDPDALREWRGSELGALGLMVGGRLLRGSLLRARLAARYTLTDLPDNTGGPARYVRVAETGGKLGLITPMTHNFCESCNRVRITCTGTIHTCLGHEDATDLRKPLRAAADNDLLNQAIDSAIGTKPKGHDFMIDRRHSAPAVARAMSMTGG